MQRCAAAAALAAALTDVAAQVEPAAAAATAVEPAAIDLVTGGAGSEPSLTIRGTWPTQCPPSFERASIEGGELRVDARTLLSLCERKPTAYTIELNPALAVGASTLVAGVYRITYYAASGGDAPSLQAFALVDTNAAAKAAPETGFWWAAAAAKQGAGRSVFSLELQGSQLSAALMSYDRDGRGSWQFGAGQLTGRIAHVPLLQLTGGSDPFAAASTAAHAESGVVLDLEFHSNSQATAWLSRSAAPDAGLQLQSLELVRLPFVDSAGGAAWQGDWVLVGDAPGAVPQRVHLESVKAPGGHFALADARAGITIDCVTDPARPELPPRGCALRDHDVAAGYFHSVAISRMSGTRDGAALQLLRITP